MVSLFTNNDKNIADTSKFSTRQSGNEEMKQSNNVPALSPFLEKFLTEHEERIRKYFQSTGQAIRVSEVLGSIALLYERIRNIVEYKGEHVLRRNAIERILKRLLWERSSQDTERIGSILLRELIWAKYLPNDTVPKAKIREVGRIISKYLYFLGRFSEKGSGIPLPTLREWLWGIASCEIEETLDPSSREQYVQLMLEWFNTYFIWDDHDISDHEKQFQLYLAIHRSLTKSDEEVMRYHLLVKEFPDWPKIDIKDLDPVVENFFKLYEEIEGHINFKNKLVLYRQVQKQTAPFEVIKEMVENESSVRQILSSKEKLEWKVREICQKKYTQIQSKVSRGILRSILYIFITKVILALIIEVPYELYRFGGLKYIPIIINIIFPPGMMWLIGLTIKAPGEDNTRRILNKLNTIVYINENVVRSPITVTNVKRTSLLTDIFAIIYTALFFLVFGAITYILLNIGYTLLGIIIFFVFLSLVMLFGFRVRYTASELKVTTDREGILGHLFNNLTLPFLSTGLYLSKGLAKINFLTVFLDFLIEAPLKTIIEVIEEWTSFIREKREEVVEVPE